MHLFETQRMHIFPSSTSFLNSRGRAGPKTRARNSIQVSHMDGPGAIPAFTGCALARSSSQKGNQELAVTLSLWCGMWVSDSAVAIQVNRQESLLKRSTGCCPLPTSGRGSQGQTPADRDCGRQNVPHYHQMPHPLPNTIPDKTDAPRGKTDSSGSCEWDRHYYTGL